jgi:small subunit ribosomal protein S4
MGDPKKFRKKYAPARHPWRKNEIDEAKLHRRDFGLRTRRETLIAETFLKKYKDIAKKLIAHKSVQGEKETAQVLGKMQGLGLLQVGAKLDQILALEVPSVLQRRLQSILYKKGLARTMKQARQFIVHRHVAIGDKEITAPSYLVSLEEENNIMFKGTSVLNDESHPERVNEAAKIHEEAQAIKVKGKENEKRSKSEEIEIEALSEEEIKEADEVVA